MPRIRLLDPLVANQIAAGEVIERPASVVKELLENAIDAGATRIDIDLLDGGTALIRVTDDGCGIDPDDLPLAITAHATSKLASVDDLLSVATLGFRGEALASMAAVAELRLVSRPPDQLAAAEISAAGATLSAPRPAAAPVGTRVEVRNLFFNIPARRRYLRQPATELAHITEQIARVALAHPHVAFRQTHAGRDVRVLPATSDRRERIADFYGADLAAQLFPLHADERGLAIDGFFAPPASARASSKWQYVFLNGRFIADRSIQFAIREAFRGLVEPGRYPVLFLFLSTVPSSVDVNVHPTKIEVRWRDAGLVQSQVLAVLRETLLSRDLTPALRVASSHAATNADAPHAAAVRAAIADYFRHAPAPAATPLVDPPRHGAPQPFAPRPPLDSDRAALREPGPPPEPEPAPRTALQPPPQTRALQIHNMYLVVESADGLMIVDQHALHERVLYEQFRQRVLRGPLESQRLLIPETVAAGGRQQAAAEVHAQLLARLGIELAPIGPHALAVHAFPTLLSRVSPVEFLRDLLDRIAEPHHAESDETLLDALLSMMACKAAVKAGDPLSPHEIEALMAARVETDRGSNCPHGRPTTLQLSLRDLDRQFKRT
ncbi:MAG: DNA mismatch repair endonuclease MutL [Phycisphaerae bacterium]